MPSGSEGVLRRGCWLEKLSDGKFYGIRTGGKVWKRRYFVVGISAFRCYKAEPPKKEKAQKVANGTREVPKDIEFRYISYVHSEIQPEEYDFQGQSGKYYFAIRYMRPLEGHFEVQQIVLILAADSAASRHHCIRQLTTALEKEAKREDLVETQKKMQSSQSDGKAVLFSPINLKALVSKKKLRYREAGFDLDLSYITDRIIAMGFPSNGTEGIYRNNLLDVQNFFNQRHPNHYKIYNLCCEKAYDADIFQICARYPWDDHNPPPLDLMIPLLEDIKAFLDEHEDNVVAIHCKAGKGRTGTVIAAYLLYDGTCVNSEDALCLFSMKRTSNMKGVTIPSQIRYVGYLEKMLHERALDRATFTFAIPATIQTVQLLRVMLHSTPHFDYDNGCDPYWTVSVRSKLFDPRDVDKMPYTEVYNSRFYKPTQHFVDTRHIILEPHIPLLLTGDFKIHFYDADIVTSDLMFTCWFNSSMMPVDDDGFPGDNPPKMSRITLTKPQIDLAHKDKTHSFFDKDFRLSIWYVRANTPFLPDDDAGLSGLGSRLGDSFPAPASPNRVEAMERTVRLLEENPIPSYPIPSHT